MLWEEPSAWRSSWAGMAKAMRGFCRGNFKQHTEPSASPMRERRDAMVKVGATNALFDSTFRQQERRDRMTVAGGTRAMACARGASTERRPFKD